MAQCLFWIRPTYIQTDTDPHGCLRARLPGKWTNDTHNAVCLHHVPSQHFPYEGSLLCLSVSVQRRLLKGCFSRQVLGVCAVHVCRHEVQEVGKLLYLIFTHAKGLVPSLSTYSVICKDTTSLFVCSEKIIFSFFPADAWARSTAVAILLAD